MGYGLSGQNASADARLVAAVWLAASRGKLEPERAAAQNSVTHLIAPDTFRREGNFLPPALISWK